jgi:two-component system chemotaxis response regulator CheB
MAPEIIRVLIIDDSAYMRKALRTMLESSPYIEVCGAAFSVASGLEKIEELNPDVVTIDLFMDGEFGVEFVRAQMQRRPLPIVVCSSASEDNSAAIDALQAGAIEFVQKPTAPATDEVMSMRNELIATVLAAAQVPFEKLVSLSAQQVVNPEVKLSAGIALPGSHLPRQVDAVLIGLSTGGPRALRQLLPGLTSKLEVPVAIVLHMPVGYTSAMAQKLDATCELDVVESYDGLEMRSGQIILAQAGVHTRLERRPDNIVVTRLVTSDDKALYCPSVNELFQTGSQVYGSRVLGVVMTGMGDDGKIGSAWIKAAGGRIFAEDKSSSIIYGMPRSVIEAGLADRTAPLQDMAELIMETVYENSYHR